MTLTLRSITAGTLLLLAPVITPASAQHMMQSVGEEEFIVDPDLLRSTRITPEARAPQTIGERVVMDAEATVEEIAAAADEARVFFEPRGLLGQIRERPDLVLLMRHGPTDWSFLDRDDVEPEDCSSQRVMTVQGREDMRALSHVMAQGGIVPSHIVSSRWCRNQDTTRNFLAGLRAHPNSARRETTLEWDDGINLLLSSQGAETVTPLRQRIADWNARQDGETDEEPLPGPLLIISHFTNIAELTEFNVYEGEMLVLDPDRNNRVLGYLRLADAAPDIGHFDPSVAAAPASSTTDAMSMDGVDEATVADAAADPAPAQGPMAVTVVGREGEDVILADEAGRPLRMSADELLALLETIGKVAPDDDET